MSTLPVLPLYVNDFIADTPHLNAEETGAYLMLMMMAWKSPDGSLPDDDVILSRWARVSLKCWRRIKPTVMAFWGLDDDGRWTQVRLTQVKRRASQRANVARENGSLGGRPKSLKDKGTSKPNGFSNGNPEANPSISIFNNNPIVPNSKPEIEAAFADFKAAYPKRDGSQDWTKARTRLGSLIGKGTDPARLVAAAVAYRREVERKGNLGTGYVKQAATFLSGAWEEYGVVSDAAASPSSAPALPPDWPHDLPHPDRVRDAMSRRQWPGSWGAQPGQPGCRLSPAALEKFGLTASLDPEPRAEG